MPIMLASMLCANDNQLCSTSLIPRAFQRAWLMNQRVPELIMVVHTADTDSELNSNYIGMPDIRVTVSFDLKVTSFEVTYVYF